MTEAAPKKKASRKSEVVLVEQQAVHHTPDQLLAIAVQNQYDLGYVEKLMDLRDRWLNEKKKEEFSEAFVTLQEIMPNLQKTKQANMKSKTEGKEGPKYNFIDLGTIGQEVKVPMAQVGLSYKWIEKEDGNKLICQCVVRHKNGFEDVGEPMSGEPDDTGYKNKLQAKKSTLSYLRRATLEAALGLSSVSMDDDGQGGAGSGVDLPKPSAGQMKKMLELVEKGELTLEQITEKFTLSEKLTDDINHSRYKYEQSQKNFGEFDR